MKLKLKTSAAPDSDAPPANDAFQPPSATTPALKIKFRTSELPASEPTESQVATGPLPPKRKYTKKPKVDANGNSLPPVKTSNKKRAREEDGDVEPSAKRKPKPTAKSLAQAHDSDDEDDLEAMQSVSKSTRPAPVRTQSIKLSIKPKAPGHGLQRSGTAILKVKGGGKPPVRPFGVGYDSEAEEAEVDPAIESQFVLRMAPGPDCELLRKAIDDKTIGKSMSQGGPGVHYRFFDREGRRAMLTIENRMYAASMVELPTVIESLKSWNKKDWVKTADVCQMLLVLGRVQSEDEAKRYPRPSYIQADSHRFPHGLTPPMRWARKLRFRPRKSYLDVERAEAEMNRLLAEDEAAVGSRYDLVDSDHETSEESSSDDEAQDEGIADAPTSMEGAVQEVDEGDLEQMLHAGFMEDDIEIQASGDQLDALFGNQDATVTIQTPTAGHEVALHTINRDGHLVAEAETAASTPATPTSPDDDDDDDDADSDEDRDDVDDAAVAEEQRKEQLRMELAELDRAIQQNIEARDRQNNAIFKKRMQSTIDKQKADRDVKRKQLDEDIDD